MKLDQYLDLGGMFVVVKKHFLYKGLVDCLVYDWEILFVLCLKNNWSKRRISRRKSGWPSTWGEIFVICGPRIFDVWWKKPVEVRVI